MSNADDSLTLDGAALEMMDEVLAWRAQGAAMHPRVGGTR